ncbi:hypothetical protein [Streptomyces sp. CRN 30]|uniref:hypothetical protein n=1 Tax=Streptomyces sp. CRN 30 TaxID=3075613 RepID=UPI002A838AA3|nr:hypothetical protein [Streptomyces sp. CRN 30]
MESGPAIFTGVVFALFGAGLAAWTATRLKQRLPVAEGAHPVASATVAGATALIALALAVWCFGRL